MIFARFFVIFARFFVIFSEIFGRFCEIFGRFCSFFELGDVGREGAGVGVLVFELSFERVHLERERGREREIG